MDDILKGYTTNGSENQTRNCEQSFYTKDLDPGPSSFQVRDAKSTPRTTIGSGATPAFKPRKAGPSLVTEGVPFQKPTTAAASDHAFNMIDSAYCSDKSPANYWSTQPYGEAHHQDPIFVLQHGPQVSSAGYMPSQFIQGVTTPQNPSRFAVAGNQMDSSSRTHLSKRQELAHMHGNNGMLPQLAVPKDHPIPAAANATHSNSKTWVSQRQNEFDKWNTVQANLNRHEHIIREALVPKNFEEWLQHRAGQLEDQKQETERLLKLKKLNKALKSAKIVPPKPIRNEKGGEGDGKGRMTNLKTIWQEPLDPSTLGRPFADWPCMEEMKEEGDQRATSSYKRFLPHPRAPNQFSKSYKDQLYQEQFEFDRPKPKRTFETCEEEMKPDALDMIPVQIQLIGNEIMKELKFDRPSLQAMGATPKQVKDICS